MTKTPEPKHFKIFRVIGFSLLMIGIILIILGVILGSDTFAMPNMGMLIPGVFLLFVSTSFIFIGLSPKIRKIQIDSAKYFQEENKDTLIDMANTKADIHKDAIVEVAKAVNEGLRDYKYCKHCGAKNDDDSKFCSECGKPQ